MRAPDGIDCVGGIRKLGLVRPMNGEVLRFIVVGCCNTALTLFVIYGAKYVFGLSDVAANMFGYACGLVLSFFLNSQWTFRYRGSMAAAMLRFASAVAVAYGANLASLVWMIDVVRMNSYLAHFLGMIAYTTIFFGLSRTFVFRDRSYRPGEL